MSSTATSSRVCMHWWSRLPVSVSLTTTRLPPSEQQGHSHDDDDSSQPSFSIHSICYTYIYIHMTCVNYVIHITFVSLGNIFCNICSKMSSMQATCKCAYVCMYVRTYVCMYVRMYQKQENFKAFSFCCDMSCTDNEHKQTCKRTLLV